MTPQEFTAKWGVTRLEMCQLIGRDINTVNHWFSKKSPRQPEPDMIFLLDLIDDAWSHRKQQTENLPAQIWAIYEMVYDRLP